MSTAITRPEPSFRRLQFLLRTLLPAMLLFGVLLGLWVHVVQPYWRETQLIEVLRKHIAFVNIETHAPPWLRSVAGNDFLHRIVEVALVDPKTTDEALRLLKRTPRLRVLAIGHECKITPAELRHLTEMDR